MCAPMDSLDLTAPLQCDMMKVPSATASTTAQDVECAEMELVSVLLDMTNLTALKYGCVTTTALGMVYASMVSVSAPMDTAAMIVLKSSSPMTFNAHLIASKTANASKANAPVTQAILDLIVQK